MENSKLSESYVLDEMDRRTSSMFGVTNIQFRFRFVNEDLAVMDDAMDEAVKKITEDAGDGDLVDIVIYHPSRVDAIHTKFKKRDQLTGRQIFECFEADLDDDDTPVQEVKGYGWTDWMNLKVTIMKTVNPDYTMIIGRK